MTQPTTIRPATLDDAQGIANVQVETWRSAYRGVIADEFLDAMSEDERTSRWSEIVQRPKHATFVAEIEGHGIVGFANGGPERDGQEDFRGELCGLYVLSEWQGQGQGVGRQLVATFVQWLMDLGFDTMLVWTLADNPYWRFYERLAGKLVAEKEIEIGEQKLLEVAFGWDDLGALI
jgi:ribosomal protein S18 acetylase RimI-like enzyme